MPPDPPSVRLRRCAFGARRSWQAASLLGGASALFSNATEKKIWDTPDTTPIKKLQTLVRLVYKFQQKSNMPFRVYLSNMCKVSISRTNIDHQPMSLIISK